METVSESERSAVVEPSGRYTSPLGLVSRLRQTEIKLDMIPVLDLIVVALLMSLVFTRFVMIPGVKVDLPQTELRMQYRADTLAVLTIENRGMLFFDGAVYAEQTIERAFERYIAGSASDAPVLLIKAEASLELERFLEICQMAEAAGFVQVQLVGRKTESELELIPSVGTGLESRGDFKPIL